MAQHKFTETEYGILAALDNNNDTWNHELISLHKKMKFSIKVFFSKCDQIRRSCGFGKIYWINP